jgi:hypothetical protein
MARLERLAANHRTIDYAFMAGMRAHFLERGV